MTDSLFITQSYYQMQTYVVDGSGFLFRAYYGLPELIGNEGRNVNILYGFTSMMIGLLMEKPDHFVIARDAGMDTVRRENFAEYKANRPSAPEDLKRQIGATQRMAEEMGFPSYMVPGYEADDIIYTIARDRSQVGDHVTIVSSDKDLKQLISPTIHTLDTMKKSRTTVESFIQEYEFPPALLLDYLSLIGDASDNIPWVAGIGPKTASKLIKTYQTLENIYDHLDEIGGSIADKLRKNHDNAIMSKCLITLLETPWLDQITPQDLTRTPDRDELTRVIVYQYGFHWLEKKLTQLKNEFQMPTQMGLFG